jgi:hypothetical protein
VHKEVHGGTIVLKGQRSLRLERRHRGVINGGPRLLNATGVDVVLVRDHGPAKADIVQQQIHTFGVCNPTCADLQISMHAAAG